MEINVTRRSVPKQMGKNNESRSKKVVDTVWWYANKVKKQEKIKQADSQKGEVSKDEKASKTPGSRKGDGVVSKKKALQLKKKRQKKNRLLQKKMHASEDSAERKIPRKPKITRNSKKEKVAQGKKTMQKTGDKIEESHVAGTKLKSGLQTDKKVASLKEAKLSQILEKSGGQKKRKRKKVKKFKTVKTGAQAASGGKTEESHSNQDISLSTSEQDRNESPVDAEMKEKSETTKKDEEGGSKKKGVSSNWKALMPELEKTKKKEGKRKKYGKDGKVTTKPSKPDIWFDDVDPSLIKANEETGLDKEKDEDADNVQSETVYNPLLRRDAQNFLTKCLAMDCEMVGIGPKGSESVLARVSIVNQFGACVFDKYVIPREIVTDYRTFVSGIRPSDLKNKGESFETVQKEVSDILKGRIVVGHAIHNDFKVLYFSHPRSLIRDTSTYQPFRDLFKSKRPGLKKLTEAVLKVKVQKGEHNSVEDAQAAMKLYLMHRKQWEKSLREKPKKATTGDKKATKMTKTLRRHHQGPSND